MNSVLVTNVVTYVLMIAVLTFVVMLPDMIMKRFQTDGRSVERAGRRSVR